MSSTESLRKRIERGRLLERSVRARNAELELCRRDPAYWLWNDQRYVWTKDESDHIVPVKAFPDEVGARFTLAEIHREPLIMIAKSRQIMATWLVCAYWLWWAMFFENQLLFIQSKKEEDAANLVFNKTPGQGRISFIYENLPGWMKPPIIPSMGVMIFPNNGSKIWGIPQGSDIIRSYTASGVFSDEFAFQPFAEDAYKAAKPSAKKIVGVSSANPGFFARLCGFEKNDRSVAG
jgi:hypothetical protein